MSTMTIRGDIVLGESIIEGGLLRIAKGKIVGVETGAAARSQAKNHLNVESCLVMPGFIDGHHHSRSNLKEGMTRSTSGAAAGGVTTIVDHPFDGPEGIFSAEGIRDKKRRIQREALVDVALLGAVRPHNLQEVRLLVDEGVAGFKFSLYEADINPKRFPRMPHGALLEAFSLIQDQGAVAMVHAEDDELIKYIAKTLADKGDVSPSAHIRSRPRVSETSAVTKALELALATNVHLHLAHLSLPDSVRLVDFYRSKGAKVTVETCPHYLVLSEEDYAMKGRLLKVNPPLRSAGDREELWELLSRGSVDVVSSDHCPFNVQEKSRDSIFDVPAGLPGAETMAPLVFSHGVMSGRIHPDIMTRVFSRNPAVIMGLFPRKGAIIPGADADIAIIDPSAEWTVDGTRMFSCAGWSPYDGMRLKGKVVATLVRGNLVYSRDSIQVEPGYGEFCARVSGSTRESEW